MKHGKVYFLRERPLHCNDVRCFHAYSMTSVQGCIHRQHTGIYTVSKSGEFAKFRKFFASGRQKDISLCTIQEFGSCFRIGNVYNIIRQRRCTTQKGEVLRFSRLASGRNAFCNRSGIGVRSVNHQIKGCF